MDKTPERAAAILREWDKRNSIMPKGSPCHWCGEPTDAADSIHNPCFIEVEQEAAKVGCELVDTNEGLRIKT